MNRPLFNYELCDRRESIDILAMSLLEQGQDISDLFTAEEIAAYKILIANGQYRRLRLAAAIRHYLLEPYY